MYTKENEIIIAFDFRMAGISLPNGFLFAVSDFLKSFGDNSLSFICRLFGTVLVFLQVVFSTQITNLFVTKSFIHIEMA